MQEISTFQNGSFIEAIKANRLLTTCLVISGILHLFFVLSTDFTKQQCLDCEVDNLVIKISLTSDDDVPEIIITKQILVHQQNTPPLKNNSKIEQPTKNVKQTKGEIAKKIDYNKLNNSISKFLVDNKKQRQMQWDIQCETNKNEHNTLDCISDEERFGLKNEDPFGLALAFNSLKVAATTQQKEKIFTALVAKESAVIAMLDMESIDPITRALLSDQKDYLTRELHFQDCGSNANSGNCAGEVDLFKLAGLVTSLLSK